MPKNKSFNCPICASGNSENILCLDCGKFDGSPLYRFTRIESCKRCGHIYNGLSAEESRGLKRYYDTEYAPLNLNSPNKVGDVPGSVNDFTLKRYSQLYNLISSYARKDSRVLDIGCAMGGFLHYLGKRGFKKLFGIDISKNYVNYAKKSGYTIKFGSADSIPFKDGSYDLLVMDQVMEHLVDPRRAFREAKRVLTEGGLLCIGIPDAERYGKLFFFDFYWFLMREHIQHFDFEHIKMLAKSEGFEVVNSSRTETPIVSKKMILPNLNIIFRLTAGNGKLNITKNCFGIKMKIKQYLGNEFKKLKKKMKIINNLAISQKPLYIWGASREFLYLYASANLKRCNIAGIIDMNKLKQKLFSVDGIKIIGPNLLRKASVNSALLIAATAHVDSIKRIVGNIGFKGEVMAW